MQPIIEQVQPYVATIVLAIVGLLVTVILGAVNVVKAKAGAHFDAKLTATQRETLHKIAGEAYAYAETAFKDTGGSAKLAEALQYASSQLINRGINVSELEVRAAIEKALLEFQGSSKTV